MQYHASLITADGAHHCPLGSIWPFFSWCQIVRFIMLVPNCPGAKLSGAKLSWCQIVQCQIVLVPNCPTIHGRRDPLTLLGLAYLSISKDRGNTFPKKLLFHLFLVMTGDQICRGACLTCWVDVLGLRFTFLCPYKETTAGACHRSLPLQSTPQVQIRANNPLQYDKTTPFEIDGGWTDMPREEYKMLTYFLMWKMDLNLVWLV